LKFLASNVLNIFKLFYYSLCKVNIIAIKKYCYVASAIYLLKSIYFYLLCPSIKQTCEIKMLDDDALI